MKCGPQKGQILQHVCQIFPWTDLMIAPSFINLLSHALADLSADEEAHSL